VSHHLGAPAGQTKTPVEDPVLQPGPDLKATSLREARLELTDHLALKLPNPGSSRQRYKQEDSDVARTGDQLEAATEKAYPSVSELVGKMAVALSCCQMAKGWWVGAGPTVPRRGADERLHQVAQVA
jgi:hypothetical protein